MAKPITNTVEISTYGSNLFAHWTARDMILSLCDKLKMCGIPHDGPVQVFCIVKNVSIPESVVSKKHNTMKDHTDHDAAITGILQAFKEDSQTNMANLLMKVLAGPRQYVIVTQMLILNRSIIRWD
jgi:hypothetical protein